MPSIDIEDVVQQAVAQTFENMAFIEAVPVKTPSADILANPCHWAKIAILEPDEGEMLLLVPSLMALEVAQDILMPLDESAITDADQNALDMFAEMLNTIAGVIMGDITPPDQTFRLGLPETGLSEHLEMPSGGETFHFAIEGRTLALTLRGPAFY